MIMMDDIERFAERASAHFMSNEVYWFYTDDEIMRGEFFALCLGFNRDRVVVFKIDSDAPVMNFEHRT